jgi:hypothetical protein
VLGFGNACTPALAVTPCVQTHTPTEAQNITTSLGKIFAVFRNMQGLFLQNSAIPLGQVFAVFRNMQGLFSQNSTIPIGQVFAVFRNMQGLFSQNITIPLGKVFAVFRNMQGLFPQNITTPPLGKSLWCCFCRHVDCVLSLHFIGAHP